MNNKTIIISPLKFIKLIKFLNLTGFSEYKLKQVKSEKLIQDELILITAPDGNLFVNMQSFQKWCISNQPDVSIEFITTGLSIITANLYAEISGYSIKAIKRKIEDGVWNTQLAFRAPNAEIMVNINSVEKWIISKYSKEIR